MGGINIAAIWQLCAELKKMLFYCICWAAIFIGPESDHWLCLSVTPSLTHSLTHSCLVNLIDVTLACEYANSKLVEVVTDADVSDEDRCGNSLLQTRPKPAYGRQGLDWNVGPGYSLGGDFLEKSHENQPKTMKNHENPTWNI